MKVFVRRIEHVECPVFLVGRHAALRLRRRFVAWGDRCRHRRDHKDMGMLNAYRYAPLATRETYGGTPMQTGVKHSRGQPEQGLCACLPHGRQRLGRKWLSLIGRQR